MVVRLQSFDLVTGLKRRALQSCGLLISVLCVFGQNPIPGPLPGEEFVGPFSSWTNVRTAFGAAGNGVADDTAALQAALDNLGSPPHPSVLYLPAGTYRITRTLTLATRIYVSVVGEHPDNTTIKWSGAANGVMLNVNGIVASQVSRITLDGNNSAAVGIDQAWDGQSTHFDTHNQYADDAFRNIGIGIRGGHLGFGAADSVVLRCRFIGNTVAGVSVENWNALNWFIRDSAFQDNYVGVTNTLGAGNFHVYNSLFQRSVRADMEITSLEYFSIRNNVSSGSGYFFLANSIGSTPDPLTFQKNIILDPTVQAISIGNAGPVVLLDNVIRSQAGHPAVTVIEGFSPNPVNANVVSIGNTFSTANPYSVSGHLLTIDDTSSVGNISAAIPSITPVPVSAGRTVFEVPSGAGAAAIQQVIDTAVAQRNGLRPVVHLPSGTYSINQTLNIPSGSDVQVVGDGGYSAMLWSGTGTGPVLSVGADSHAALRDFRVHGNNLAKGILVNVNDQPGNSIFLDQAGLTITSQNNLLVEGLDHTNVTLSSLYHDSSTLSVRVVGGPLLAGGQAAEANVNILGGGDGENQLTYSVENGGRLLAEDVWYEGAPPGFVNLAGSGTFTLDGATVFTGDPGHGGLGLEIPPILANNFNGSVSILSAIIGRGGINISGQGSSMRVLAMGVDGPAGTANFFQNSSAAGQAALLNSNLKAATGSIAVADQTSNIASIPNFVRSMVAQLRNAYPYVITPRPSIATDLRFFRVDVENSTVGIHLKATSAPVVAPPTATGNPLVTAAVPGSIRNNFSGWVGMQFTVGAAALNVSALGRMYVTGNTGTHLVKLVRAGDGIDVPGSAVSISLSGGTLGQFVYGQLPGTVTLQPNTAYFLVSQETAGGDLWYDYGPVSPANVAAVNGPVYWNGASWFLVGAANTSYVPLSLLYTSATTSPTPPPPPPPPTAGSALVTAFSGGPARNNFSGWAGMRFTVGPTALTVNSLGRIYVLGNSGTHVVKLVRSDGSDLPGASVNVELSAGTPGQFNYGQLASAVTLPANTTYFLVSQEVEGGDQWFDYGPVSAANVVAVNGPVYGTSVGWYPLGGVNSSYVPVNLLYSTGATTPPAPVAPPSGSGTEVVTGFVRGALRNNFSGFVGMQFTLGSTALTVNSLGRIYVPGNSGTHLVKLVRAGDGVDVPGASVSVIVSSGTSGQFTYAQLASAVTLQPNTAYLLVSQEVAGGDQWYDYGPVSITGVASINSPVYWNGAGWYPLGIANNGYVPLSFLYSTVAGAGTPQPPVTPPSGTGTELVTGYISGPLRNNFGSWVGMKIAIGPTALNVTSLGRINVSGNSGTHVVKLVRASDGADVPGGSANVAVATGKTRQFTYAQLGGAVTLQANTTYYLVSQEASGGDQWYDYGPVTVAGVAVVNGPVYWNGASWFPVAIPNNSYVPVSLLYSTGSTAPAQQPPPSGSSTLFVTGNLPGPVRNNFSGWVGMQLTVGASALNLTSLGRIYVSGNSSTHTVKLVRASDGSDLVGGSVTVPMAGGTAGQFVYGQLTGSVTLQANTTYYLVSQETFGGDQWYDIGPVTVAGAARVDGPVYWDGNHWVLVTSPNTSYVPVNFAFK